MNKHEEAVEKWGVILNKDEVPKKSFVQSIAEFFSLTKSKILFENNLKHDSNHKGHTKKRIVSVIE